jgi:hypothetical protein
MPTCAGVGSPRVADTTPTDPATNRRNRGVIVVHGVGEQRKSDTVLDIGDPLFDWLQRWYTAFDPADPMRVGRTELGFAPIDVGQADRPPWSRFELPHHRWSVAEVWWSTSNRKPDLQTMLVWSWLHLWDIVNQLRRSVAERVDRLLHPAGHPSQPSGWVEAIDLLNSVGLLVLYPLAAIAGYVLLIPLMVAAQIPIEPFQSWVLLRLITPLLVIDAGEFRTFVDDEIQSANMRRRAADAVNWLVSHESCAEVILVAHSEGCVVSFAMLTDPEFADQARKVRKLITIGEGLNKSWLVKPDLTRLHGPLTGDIVWVDIWASFDPVPAGPIDPPPGVRVYVPTGAAALQVGDRTTPISVEVTNEMNVLSDHGGYWHNDEQVLPRLAAEIDCFDHTRSPFWVTGWTDAARERRERVAIVALLRALAILGDIGMTAAAWLQLILGGISPTTSLKDVPGPWLMSAPIALLTTLDRLVRALFPPAADLIDQLLAFPAYAASAIIVAVAWWAVYHLVRLAFWQPWDRRARDRLVRAAALAARAGVE